jgi:hypothetical protein
MLPQNPRPAQRNRLLAWRGLFLAPPRSIQRTLKVLPTAAIHPFAPWASGFVPDLEAERQIHIAQLLK